MDIEERPQQLSWMRDFWRIVLLAALLETALVVPGLGYFCELVVGTGWALSIVALVSPFVVFTSEVIAIRLYWRAIRVLRQLVVGRFLTGVGVLILVSLIATCLGLAMFSLLFGVVLPFDPYRCESYRP